MHAINNGNIILRFAIIFLFASEATLLPALPIEFRRTQAPLEYDEIRNDEFIIYHDRRTPFEAKSILNTLESARPYLEKWFEIKRTRPLPIIMSAVTSNASFANFITDAVELQTMGLGGRDLALHEYVHSSMYRHLDNWLGPTGSIIHLPWMPAWWIEGLAEALTRSIGSDVTAAIEKNHALSGAWPSYDKLHSLYGSGDFLVEGYATSGAFVTYILSHYDADRLPDMLNNFFRYSMPWWWPWSFVPFNEFMPMDAALKDWTGKSGRELYEEYKIKATIYWRSHADAQDVKPLVAKNERNIYNPSNHGMIVKGDRLMDLLRINNEVRELAYSIAVTIPGEKASPASKIKKEVLGHLPSDISYQRVLLPDFKAYVQPVFGDDREYTFNIVTQGKTDKQAKISLSKLGRIQRLLVSDKKLLWIEKNKEHSRLCYIHRNSLFLTKEPNVFCPMQVRYPRSLDFLGQKDIEKTPNEFITSDIWLRLAEESLLGDKNVLVHYRPDSDSKPNLLVMNEGGQPISMAITDQNMWMLTADHQGRFLRRIKTDGSCIEERRLLDFPVEIQGMKDEKILFVMQQSTNWLIVKADPESLVKRPCTIVGRHNSPLLYAFQQEEMISLVEAMRGASYWRISDANENLEVNRKIAKAPSLNKIPVAIDQNFESKPAKWRGRPLFAFPWIAADSGGSSFGIISVPLMDHMQNETVQLTMLWGIESRFPSSSLLFSTRRFEASYDLELFRRQVYNGSFEGQTMYYDDRGARISRGSFLESFNLSLGLSLTSSTLKPVIGPPQFKISGHQNEIKLDVGHVTGFLVGRLSSFVSVLALPEQINETWVYNRSGAGTTYSVGIRSSTLSLGIDASITRGKKTRVLKEVYRPLKTFVPGTGGGLNEINVSLFGPGSLTGATFGDTQARAKTSWTFPLVRDLETLVHIFYLQRLDFTAFVNYGGAWNQSAPAKGSDLLFAHGYNLDLQSDIKGVTVNVGLGTGQVAGHAFELYFLFGFDALLDQ